MLISGKEPDFEGKMKKFHTEHLHTNEETRLCLDGLAYFEVRDKNDEWIKVEFAPGDLLILPPGIYHRLSLDEKVLRGKRIFHKQFIIHLIYTDFRNMSRSEGSF